MAEDISAADHSPVRPRIELRKYPNRRYYDCARSQHVTLEEIYGMVRGGSEVQVTDSKTGEDITAKVLAQIILEHDPPKLGIFPVQLLHELIRANEPLMREFVEKYFNQALAMFLESQRQLDRYLRQAFALQSPIASSQEWTRLMMGPLAPMFFRPPAGNGPHKNLAPPASDAAEQLAQGTEASPTPPALGAPLAVGQRPAADEPAGPSLEELRTVVDELRQQVTRLQQDLDRRKHRSAWKADAGSKPVKS